MGGYRAQGGRVPKSKKPVQLQGPFPDAATFLMALINSDADPDLKVRAAISLLPFQNPRLDERGKKRAAVERAEKLASAAGPFATPALPGKPN